LAEKMVMIVIDKKIATQLRVAISKTTKTNNLI